ncbi:MAG TPA: hypothetical protein VJY15_04330 [Candidatus Acidoferrum sp.]|nr:hypothetical protein [Candidatus Acidoferrum sp.]
MSNVDQVQKSRFHCPNCFARIYDRREPHICEQKRLTGARQINIVISTEGYGVQEGEYFSDRLAWDEMLGQIVGLTHPSIGKAYYAMLTAEEWEERERKWRNRE